MLAFRLQPFDDVLVTFNLLRAVGRSVFTLKATPRIASQQGGFTLRLIAVDRLPRTAVFTRDDQVPPEGFAET